MVERYSWDDITWIKDFFDNIKRIKKKKQVYINCAMAFDIETSHLSYYQDKKGDYHLEENDFEKHLQEYDSKPFAFMYSWQFACKKDYREIMVRGRRWEEFLIFTENLLNLGRKSKNEIMVVYVHNLAFEFQFIQSFFNWESVFARQPRKIMKALTSEGFEFRCSYFLSNMTLGKFIKNTPGTIHGKLDGEKFNYKKYRDYDTELSDLEIEYIENDVLGLAECIDIKLKEDTICSIPLTSTGYVRREVRNRCKEVQGYHQIIKKGWPSMEVYLLCKMAFRGGDTHANRIWAGKTIENVYSFDIKSSYPAWMLYEEYPSGHYEEFMLDSVEKFVDLSERKLLVMDIELFDVQLKENVAMPYIDVAHCYRQHIIDNDNGRVLSAAYVRLICTSIDFEIIREQYTWTDFNICVCYGWNKEKLPLPIRQAGSDFFGQKTTLDGVKGFEYEYGEFKNLLNAIFGMMVTALDMDEVIYKDREWFVVEADVQEELNKKEKSYNTFLLYQWGIFITAYARKHLHMMLNKVGMDAVYIDTDSIKFVNKENLKYFEEENKNIIKLAQASDVSASYVTPAGKRVTLGEWENEGIYEEFKTLGSKKYCVKKNGKYKITVSGMNKDKGSKKIHSMDDFSIGRVFEDVGRTVAFYNDYEPKWVKIKGKDIYVTPNVCILDTTYTLGITETYAQLIADNLV